MFRLHLALGLALLLAPIVGAAEEKKDPPKKKTVTVAHLKISGSLNESAPNTDPLLGQIGETFRDRIERLKKVGADKNVDAVLLEIDSVAGGWGKLNELAQAITKLRATGKKVVGFVEGGGNREYLLALSCDEVVLPEASMLMLTGLRMEVTFYKKTLEMLGIKADFIMMGDYKSAAEPYLRNSLSEANREQLTSILDDQFAHEIVGRIVKGREKAKLTAARVKKLIDEGPYAARTAHKVGLVDRLGYMEEVPDQIKAALKGDEVKLIKDYGKKKDEELDIFKLYSKLLFGPTRFGTSRGDKVAVIYATGPIMTGKSGGSPFMGSTMGSDTIVKAIRDAEEDKTVKAIVLRIDSPGGSALASDLIWKESKRCKKPLVASMSDVAGSGGYYIAMGAKKIFAEPGTITGSIGVIAGKLATKGLWLKAGMESETIARGENSGIFGDEPFSDSQRKAMKAMMQDVYDLFLDKAHAGRVAAGRKLTREQLVKLAGGRIYTGRQAKANGLIDEVGTLEDAIAMAAKLGGLPQGKDPELLQLPKPKSGLDALLGDALGARLAEMAKSPGGLAKLRGIGFFLHAPRDPVWALLPFQIEVK